MLKVKVKLRHETLKPQPLAGKLMTSKPLWQFQDFFFSGALSPFLQAERVQQHAAGRSTTAQVGLHSLQMIQGQEVLVLC